MSWHRRNRRIDRPDLDVSAELGPNERGIYEIRPQHPFRPLAVWFEGTPEVFTDVLVEQLFFNEVQQLTGPTAVVFVHADYGQHPFAFPMLRIGDRAVIALHNRGNTRVRFTVRLLGEEYRFSGEPS